jgi:hypothetical protein
LFQFAKSANGKAYLIVEQSAQSVIVCVPKLPKNLYTVPDAVSYLIQPVSVMFKVVPVVYGDTGVEPGAGDNVTPFAAA